MYPMSKILYESTIRILPEDNHFLRIGDDFDVSNLVEVEEIADEQVVPVYVDYNNDTTKLMIRDESVASDISTIPDSIHLADAIVDSSGNWSVAHSPRLPSEFYDTELYIEVVDTDSIDDVFNFLSDSYNKLMKIKSDEEDMINEGLNMKALDECNGDYVNVIFKPSKVRRKLMNDRVVIRESTNSYNEVEVNELIKCMADVDESDVKVNKRIKESFSMRVDTAKSLSMRSKLILRRVGSEFII